MKRRPRVGSSTTGCLPALCLLLAGVGSAWAAQDLSGQVVRGVLSEAGTGGPIELGTVEAISEAGRVVASSLTDSRGFFSLPLPRAGEYIVRAKALGYRTGRSDAFEMEDAGARIVYVGLEPAALEIPGLTVEAEGSRRPNGLRPSLAERGFYERMAEGRGQFLTRGDVAASDAFFTSQLFDTLDHVMPQYGRPPWARGVRYMAATERGNCGPRIFVDGIRMSMLLAEGDYLSDIAPIEEVLAAEVFWGPFQAPMRYQGTLSDNSCGVVLIWSRRRTRF